MSNNQLLERIIRYRVPHYHPNFPIILFWSQKTGSTALIQWFLYQTNLLDTAKNYHPHVHNYEHEVYKKEISYKKELMHELLDKKQKDVYKLVRDPYRRAVSSFLMLVVPRPHWDYLMQEMRQFIYNDKNSDKSISFKQFLLYMKAKGSDEDAIDGHFARQYIDGEENFINNYIHLESYNEKFKQIELKYGLKDSQLTSLSSNHHFSPLMNLKGNYADTSLQDIKYPNLPTYESFYDRENIDLVNEIFDKDFQFYGYPKM